MKSFIIIVQPYQAPARATKQGNRPLVIQPPPTAPKTIPQPAKPVLAHSPLKPVSTSIVQHQVHSEAVKLGLVSQLPAVWNAAVRLTKVALCMRCRLRGLDSEHGWGECPALGDVEAKWTEQNLVTDIREWTHEYLVPHLDDVADDDGCCMVCFFARQDSRFHDLEEKECHFPVLVGQICYVAYLYADVRKELCKLVGHMELADKGEDFIIWGMETMGGDKRWIKASTKLVWSASEVIAMRKAI